MTDFQEGYNDGLAGAGMQEREEGEFRLARGVAFFDYGLGFVAGSLDRKEMLNSEQR